MTTLFFFAAVWIVFLIFVARANSDGEKKLLLIGWGTMILGSIIGIGSRLL